MLAEYIISQLESARSHKGCVTEKIEACARQYNGEHRPCDQQVIEDSGVDLYISLTKHKTNTVMAFIRDMLQNADTFPFTLEPTPLPDLNDMELGIVASQMRQTLRQRMVDNQGMPDTPDSIAVLARQLKNQYNESKIKLAKEDAKNASLVLKDRLVESGITKELIKGLGYLVLYPYTVFEGPIQLLTPKMKWKGNKARYNLEKSWQFKAINPRNHFYSSDNKGNGTGQFDIIIDTIDYITLARQQKAEGWQHTNIKYCLKNFQSINYDWLGSSEILNHEAERTTINIIKFYGLIKGEMLKGYDIPVSRNEFYETKIIICGRRTIKIEINKIDNPNPRGIYTTSYMNNLGEESIAGDSIATILAPIERLFMAGLRNLVNNGAISALPIGEVDYQRIARYISPDQIGQLFVGMTVPVDPDTIGGGKPAHYYHNVPSNVTSYMQWMDWCIHLGDLMTGVPATLSGQSVGSGINRTFRGVMQLYANAIKGFQSAMSNVDMDILGPIGRNIYNIALYEGWITGDSQIQSLGFSGLLKEEIKNMKAMENLQLVGQMISAAPNAVPAGTLEWAVGEALGVAGIPTSITD